MNDNKLVYIASPYAGDVERNTFVAKEACRHCIKEGHTPIAVHLLYPQILNDRDPAQRKVGLELGHRVLEKCDELWICGDQISQGMEAEIKLAEQLGIPVKQVPLNQIFPVEERFAIWAEATDHTRLKGQQGFVREKGAIKGFPDRGAAEHYKRTLELRRLNAHPAANYRVESCPYQYPESMYKTMELEKIEVEDMRPDFDPDNFIVVDTKYGTTGGHCMVATLKCYLPDLGKHLWVNTNDEIATVTAIDYTWQDEDELGDYYEYEEVALYETTIDYISSPEDAAQWLPMIKKCLEVTIERDYRCSIPATWLPDSVRQTTDPVYLSWMEQQNKKVQFTEGRAEIDEAYLSTHNQLGTMEMQ